MPHRETTIEAWTLPNLGSTFERKFALTPYVSNRSFTIDYSAGGGGSLGLAREFAKFSQFVHVDQTDHSNDVGSIVRVNKDGTPVAHYLARRFEDNIDPAATVLPVVLQSLNFFLDTAGVAPYDHDPLDDANSPNPTLDPDWEYGAKSILRVLGNEFANEVQRIWRGSTVTMGDFKLTDGVDTTDAIAWDASSSVLRTRLETDIASITNVIVRGDGSLKTPWEVEFTDPAGDISYTLAVTANTTDGVFSTDTVRNGGTLDPSPWHRSYNAVTKTEHGNYQAFEVLHRDDVPAGLQAASTDEYFLRVNLDDVNDPEDYGGAQVIANVDPGSVYRASVPVWADGTGYDFRLVLRHLDEAHIANGGDIAVPADTLTTLNIDPFKFGDNTNEIIYRVGILETTNIGDVYIAFQSAILAPGFDEEPLGKIMNDLLVPINARGLLTWVTPTWTDALDSAGNAWDQKLQWTISHRQSLLQLVEFAREWGYESTGIYWSEANSRFEWGLFNPGGGGTVITDETIVIGDTEGSGPVLHRLPGATAAWAFGRNGAWGRYEDTDLVTALGRLEVMDLDRQSRDNLTVHAMERIEAEKESATGQRLRLRTDRFTAFVDMSPGDFIEVNLGPRFINDVYRIAGITDAVDEEGNEYQEFHIGTLVKDAATAETDTVRELYRKFQTLGDRDRGGVVDPVQIVGSGTIPWLVASSEAPDGVKAVAGYHCDGDRDEAEINAAAQAFPEVWLAGGGFYCLVPDGSYSIDIPNGVALKGFGDIKSWLEPMGTETITAQSWLVRSSGSLEQISMFPYTELIGCLLWNGPVGEWVRDCYFEPQENTPGMWVQGGRQLTIEHLWVYHFFSGPTYSRLEAPCLVLSGTDHVNVSESQFDWGSEGIVIEDPGANQPFNIRVRNCVFRDHGYDGLLATECGDLRVEDSFFQQVGRQASGAITPGVTGDIRLVDPESIAHIRGNTLRTIANSFASSGIVIDGGTGESITIRDNLFDDGSWAHNVFLDGAYNVKVTDNDIPQPGGSTITDTYDGIHVTGASDEIHVYGNVIGVNTLADSIGRYGINFADASITNGFAHANRIVSAKVASGDINVTAGAAVTQRDNV